MTPNEEDMYQFEMALKEVKDEVRSQNHILSEVSNVLKNIDKTMQGFSSINREQAKQKVTIKNLEEDIRELKEFQKQADCRTNKAAIKNLQAADSSKNNSAVLAIITIGAAGMGSFLSWLLLTLTKG